MKRHWLIRHNNKTSEYVPVYDIWDKQIDQVIDYCLQKDYDLSKVFVLESATKYVYSNILKL